MVRYFCDRCGAEINPFTSNIIKRKYTAYELKAITPVDREYMLCDTCTAQFEGWLDGEKETNTT